MYMAYGDKARAAALSTPPGLAASLAGSTRAAASGSALPIQRSTRVRLAAAHSSACRRMSARSCSPSTIRAFWAEMSSRGITACSSRRRIDGLAARKSELATARMSLGGQPVWHGSRAQPGSPPMAVRPRAEAWSGGREGNGVSSHTRSRPGASSPTVQLGVHV